MEISLPEKVEYILEEFHRNGFEAFAVGGCVRDSLLGRIPEDWDITTSATPAEIKGLFRRTVDTGISHGTVTVLLEKDGFEVTTYRIDGEYEDSRHPKTVEFTRNLKEDLARRDFTINAMAYNSTTGLVDLFDGMEDLKQRRIRCVGAATERFEEDALRILRAFRFAAQLNFEIEEETLKAAETLVWKLKDISAERIREELNKLLLSKHPYRLLYAQQAGLTAVVLPELDRMLETSQETKHHCTTVGIHSLNAVQWLAEEEQQLCAEIESGTRKKAWKAAVEAAGLPEKKCILCLRWAALLHDVAKPGTKSLDFKGEAHFYGHAEAGAEQAEQILRRLKFDNETIEFVKRLILYHDCRYEKLRYGISQAGLRRIASRAGKDLMELLFYLQEADLRAQNPEWMDGKLEQLQEAKRVYTEVKERGDCIGLKALAVRGTDLIAAGYTPGKKLGAALNCLLDYVLEHPQENNREKLLELALQNLKAKEKQEP